MIEYLLFAAGLILLVKGADFLVDGSTSLAKRLGIPTLVIGLTMVAFGTSLPETFVNIFAALKGTADISFGNIIGSNMANILLILGLCAILTPLKVKHSTVWKEIPFSFLAAAMLFILADIAIIEHGQNFLFRVDGLVFLGFFIIFLYYVFEMAKKEKQDTLVVPHKHSKLAITAMIIGGLIALFLGGRWTVQGAVYIAQQIGISEYVISATIIAVGTSLPELMTSIIAARKNEIDLAVGNVVGSNIFNIFFVMGITALIAPLQVPNIITDLILLLIATFLLFIFMFIGTKHTLKRWQGITFIIFYAAYITFILIRG